MATKQEILDTLAVRIEAIVFKYENAFKASDKDLKKFFEENGNQIRKEIASESTNALHSGILSNLANDQDFTQKVLELNYIGAFNLQKKIVELSK
jgi:hypothetical protein